MAYTVRGRLGWASKELKQDEGQFSAIFEAQEGLSGKAAVSSRGYDIAGVLFLAFAAW